MTEELQGVREGSGSWERHAGGLWTEAQLSGHIIYRAPPSSPPQLIEYPVPIWLCHVLAPVSLVLPSLLISFSFSPPKEQRVSQVAAAYALFNLSTCEAKAGESL